MEEESQEFSPTGRDGGGVVREEEDLWQEMEDGTEVREDMQEENDNIQSNSGDNMTEDENLNTSASRTN